MIVDEWSFHSVTVQPSTEIDNGVPFLATNVYVFAHLRCVRMTTPFTHRDE